MVLSNLKMFFLIMAQTACNRKKWRGHSSSINKFTNFKDWEYKNRILCCTHSWNFFFPFNIERIPWRFRRCWAKKETREAQVNKHVRNIDSKATVTKRQCRLELFTVGVSGRFVVVGSSAFTEVRGQPIQNWADGICLSFSTLIRRSLNFQKPFPLKK